MLIVEDKKFINLNNVTHSEFGQYELNEYFIRFFFASFDSEIGVQEFTFSPYDNEKDREQDFNKIICAYDAQYKILDL